MVIAILFIGIFGVAQSVFAANPFTDPIDWALTMIGTLLMWLIKLLGGLMNIAVSVLVSVIGYNGFIYSQIVTVGWEIVRDVSNLFFVLFLIAIALGTVLNLENYNYRRALPRLIFMAILINFSKTISGIIIDFSQVLVHQFSAILAKFGVQQLYLSFGIERLFTLSQTFDIERAARKVSEGGGGLELLDIVTGLGAGLILLAIAFTVIVVYVIIFLFRIVGLWLLIVLAPLAYLFSSFPGGKLRGYASEWWDKFLCYCFIGPAIMFFLWLALVTSAKDVEISVAANSGFAGGLASSITEPQNLARFIITTLLLAAGLWAGKKMGCSAGALAGVALGRMQRMATRAALAPARMGERGARMLGRGAWTLGKYAGREFVDRPFMALQRAVLSSKHPVGRFLTGEGKRKKMEKLKDNKLEGLEDEKKKSLEGLRAEHDERISGIRAGRDAELKPFEEEERDLERRKKESEDLFTERLKTASAGRDRIAITKERDKAREGFVLEEQELKRKKSPIMEKYQEQEKNTEQVLQKATEKVESGHKTEKEKIEKQYGYQKGMFRSLMSEVAATGLTGNPRLWRKAWKSQRESRMGDYEIGKSGRVHQLLNFVTTQGQEKTKEYFSELKRGIAEDKRAMRDENNGETDQMKDKFFDSFAYGDFSKVPAALEIMAEEIDWNEILIDPRVKPILRQALERLYLNQKRNILVKKADGTYREKEDIKIEEKHIEKMMDSWEKGGVVNPAYFAELLRHVLLEVNNGNADIAARIAAQQTAISLGKGQGYGYGAQEVDPTTGQMKFVDMDIMEDESTGDISVEYSQKAAENFNGKLKNFQTGNLIKLLHPSVFGAQDKDGSIKGLNKFNKEFLARGFNFQILRTIRKRAHEARADRLLKLDQSEQWKKGIKEFAEELRKNYSRYGFKTADDAAKQAEIIEDLPNAIKEAVDKAAAAKVGDGGGGGD